MERRSCRKMCRLPCGSVGSFCLLKWPRLRRGPGRESVPVFFIANQGQAPAAVRFMTKSPGITAYFLDDAVVLRAAGGTVRMSFEGAETSAALEGRQPLA